MAFRAGKQILQREIRGRACPEQFGGDIEDHPLVKDPGLKMRPVNTSASHQDDIAGDKLIAAAFYMVASAAGKKKHDLIKLMIMEPDGRPAVVLEMKQTEILGQVSAFFIPVFHRILSFEHLSHTV